MFSSFPYFAPKLFYFFLNWLLVCLRAFSPYLMIELFSLFWNVIFCLYCLILSRYHFSLLSFATASWCISRVIFFFKLCSFYLFIPTYSSIFPRSYDFFVVDFLFSLISHPDFEFLFLFFRERLILSQTNFTPALIISFNSVMLFVEICVNNSFVFFQFLPWLFSIRWFLSDGNVVFFSGIILFIISVFIFSSCVGLCSVWFDRMVFRLLLAFQFG